jgi:hypothetical protein
LPEIWGSAVKKADDRVLIERKDMTFCWLYGIQVTLLAMFIGLVIFMILALDRPFRGDLGVQPEPYQLIYDHLMKP